jgi:ABC-2 type transport system permease protein
VSDLKLAVHQARYDLKAFVREPAALFFTVILPLIFLFLFVALFGNEDVDVGDGQTVSGSTYYVPGIITLSIVSATFVNLAMILTNERESGQLKRMRGTPLPQWVFIAGRVSMSVLVATGMTVLMLVIGVLVYGVDLPGLPIVGFFVTAIVAAAAFAALGIALTRIIPSRSAAPAITNAVVLPLYFISGVFVPADAIPDWVNTVGGIFPVKRLYSGLLEPLAPNASGLGVQWDDLAVVVAWGLAGAVIALLTFRWTPKDG